MAPAACRCRWRAQCCRRARARAARAGTRRPRVDPGKGHGGLQELTGRVPWPCRGWGPKNRCGPVSSEHTHKRCVSMHTHAVHLGGPTRCLHVCPNTHMHTSWHTHTHTPLPPPGPGVRHPRSGLRGGPQVQGARQHHQRRAAGLARRQGHRLHRRHDPVREAGAREGGARVGVLGKHKETECGSIDVGVCQCHRTSGAREVQVTGAGAYRTTAPYFPLSCSSTLNLFPSLPFDCYRPPISY